MSLKYSFFVIFIAYTKLSIDNIKSIKVIEISRIISGNDTYTYAPIKLPKSVSGIITFVIP